METEQMYYIEVTSTRKNSEDVSLESAYTGNMREGFNWEDITNLFPKALHDKLCELGSMFARAPFEVKFRTEGKQFFYYDVYIACKPLFKDLVFRMRVIEKGKGEIKK